MAVGKFLRLQKRQRGGAKLLLNSTANQGRLTDKDYHHGYSTFIYLLLLLQRGQQQRNDMKKGWSSLAPSTQCSTGRPQPIHPSGRRNTPHLTSSLTILHHLGNLMNSMSHIKNNEFCQIASAPQKKVSISSSDSISVVGGGGGTRATERGERNGEKTKRKRGQRWKQRGRVIWEERCE